MELSSPFGTCLALDAGLWMESMTETEVTKAIFEQLLRPQNSVYQGSIRAETKQKMKFSLQEFLTHFQICIVPSCGLSIVVIYQNTR